MAARTSKSTALTDNVWTLLFSATKIGYSGALNGDPFGRFDVCHLPTSANTVEIAVLPAMGAPVASGLYVGEGYPLTTNEGSKDYWAVGPGGEEGLQVWARANGTGVVIGWGTGG